MPPFALFVVFSGVFVVSVGGGGVGSIVKGVLRNCFELVNFSIFLAFSHVCWYDGA